MDLHPAFLCPSEPFHLPRLRALIERVACGQPVPTAIVMPCDALSMDAARDAAAAGIIVPVLVGPEAKIRALADREGVDVSGWQVVDACDAAAASVSAVSLARDGKVGMIMKGALHTDDLMRAVVSSSGGLRTGRRVSHCFVMDVPGQPRLLIITDAAVNIAPCLMEKRDIIQNAIDLAHVLGVETPRVAVLAAVETVNPDMPTTLEAAALSKMADRGQITGGLVDGPLAFDNAISPEAARVKGISSPVAGRADILVVPNLEAGNMLAKELSFVGGAEAAGVVVGAKVPIILTSRADSPASRIASCAVAALVARAAARG